MEAELKKVTEKLSEVVMRLERQEQRLMSLEREIAEQAIGYDSNTDLYGEPIAQKATRKPTFYIPKKQRNAYNITRMVGIALSIGLLLWYAAVIIV